MAGKGNRIRMEVRRREKVGRRKVEGRRGGMPIKRMNCVYSERLKIRISCRECIFNVQGKQTPNEVMNL